jgi:hypothetical protein
VPRVCFASRTRRPRSNSSRRAASACRRIQGSASRPAPGVDYHGAERAFFDYEGASNSQGFRDGEHAVAKPPGVYRIVVIGDSVGAGLKVERTEDTFPPLLQQMLDARGLKSEVINLSVSGYNTQQEVELLRERGLAYSPDLVIVAYTLGRSRAAGRRHPRDPPRRGNASAAARARAWRTPGC